MSEKCNPGDPRICNLNRLIIDDIDLIIFEIENISSFVESYNDFKFFTQENLKKMKSKCIARRKQLFERNLRKK